MNDVKWIKITTDIFDDEKIKLIESLPDADTIIVIWFKLLCLAGKANERGFIVLNDKVAYTDDMLVHMVNRPRTTVMMALETFKSFGMIEVIDDIYYLSNWTKHQNIDGLDKIKEQGRIRQQKYRKKKKMLLLEDKEKDIDKEEDIDIEGNVDSNVTTNVTSTKQTKHKFGTYKNVLLTEKEYNKLKSEHSNMDSIIDWFSAYVKEKAPKSKSHNLTIRRWVISAYNEKNPKDKRSYNGNDNIEHHKKLDELHNQDMENKTKDLSLDDVADMFKNVGG